MILYSLSFLFIYYYFFFRTLLCVTYYCLNKIQHEIWSHSQESWNFPTQIFFIFHLIHKFSLYKNPILRAMQYEFTIHRVCSSKKNKKIFFVYNICINQRSLWNWRRNHFNITKFYFFSVAPSLFLFLIYILYISRVSLSRQN